MIFLKSTDLQILAENAGISLSYQQADNISIYTEILGTWSKRINLIGPEAKQNFWSYHLLPCLWFCFKASDISDAKTSLADLGSGNGLPGLLFACLYPDQKVHLIESRAKRASFLRSAAFELNLFNVSIHQISVSENMPGKFFHAFDMVICRAFAELQQILAIAGLLVKPNGHIFALKGIKSFDEERQLNFVDSKLIVDSFETDFNDRFHRAILIKSQE